MVTVNKTLSALLKASAPAGLIATSWLIAGCELFTPIEEPTCAQFPTTCECPGGASGKTTCNLDTLTITSCDCSGAQSCEEGARALCRCQAADPGMYDAAIGLEACQGSACVCEEFAPRAGTNDTLVLPRYEGAHSLDGSCDEFANVDPAPRAGFGSRESLARMSCRLMWQTREDASRHLLGCCLVPDQDIWTFAEEADPPSVRGIDGSKGDDRIELTLAAPGGKLHQVAINARAPSPIAFSTTINGKTTTIASSVIEALVKHSGNPNVATPLDVGYTLEWDVVMPLDLAGLDRFSCQLSRYDITRAMIDRAVLDQEHTFGMDMTRAPTTQMGTCVLISP